MKTRIYNARILTMEEDSEIFQGEIWIMFMNFLKLLFWNIS